MVLLEERIKKDGEVRLGGILKVDSFLNHRIDAQLCYDMAQELKRLYDGEGVNKVLTIEASGIALAILTIAAMLRGDTFYMIMGAVMLLVVGFGKLIALYVFNKMM